MRLFSAIVPPGEVLDSLAAALEAGARPDADRIRWASRPQWHLTLAFYGSDDPATRSPWLAARVAEHPPLRLRLTGAGTFTGVLWAGVDGDLEALNRLAVEVTAAGGGSAARPYHPHLTLARWKHPRRPAAVRAAEAALATYRGPSWQAAEVVLMRSHLGAAEGSRYEELERYPLHQA